MYLLLFILIRKVRCKINRPDSIYTVEQTEPLI